MKEKLTMLAVKKDAKLKKLLYNKCHYFTLKRTGYYL